MPTSPAEITRILDELSAGDPAAADRLLPFVYDELRALARRHLAKQRAGHTLQPTALVHEAFLKIARHDKEWSGKSHFYAVAARAMRQILMDHARDRRTAKRGGGWERVTLDQAVAPVAGAGDLDLLALDDALTALGALSERQARVVELRFFAGLSIKEVAQVLGVSTTTVDDDWHLARAWLARALKAPS